ncbi:MAG: hypothetical protein GC186_08785 [Rhodobacteraceae bacterium]|nr:hypothetical protein [Paracoccaceae bacterium]
MSKPRAKVEVAQAFVVDGQSMAFGDLAASLKHLALAALTKSMRQISGWARFRHARIKLQKGNRPA